MKGCKGESPGRHRSRERRQAPSRGASPAPGKGQGEVGFLLVLKLVVSVCQDKEPHTEGLKQQSFVASHFWRLEVSRVG